MRIVKIDDNRYDICDEGDRIAFSKEKFEDLYYAVPLNSTSFLRLLQDNICQNAQERHLLNHMLERSGDPSAMLEQMQKQIQCMQL